MTRQLVDTAWPLVRVTQAAPPSEGWIPVPFPAAVRIQTIGSELHFEQPLSVCYETHPRPTAYQQHRTAARRSEKGIQDRVLEHGQPGS